MSSYTVSQNVNHDGIKCTVTGERVTSAVLSDSNPDIQYTLDVSNNLYMLVDGSDTTFTIPLSALKGAANWNDSFLKHQFKLLLNDRPPAIAGLFVTQRLPTGTLTDVVSGNNKATFTVNFAHTTFNEKNTNEPPIFKIKLEDQQGNYFADAINGDATQIISSTKQSDGNYKFTLNDASLNNGATYSIVSLHARNNVLKDINVTVPNGTRVRPSDKPSLLEVKSIDTLLVDGSGVAQIAIELEKKVGDFNFLAAQAVLQVLQVEGNNMVQSAKTFPLDVSNGQILDENKALIGDDASGIIRIVIPKSDFFGLENGADFNLITRLDGKNQADASGALVPGQAFIKGNERTSSEFTVNHPFASTEGLKITSVDETNGTQTVEITLAQSLSSYFDNSGDLTSAGIYADAVDASGAVTKSDTAFKNIKNDLKSQIDTSGSTDVILVELGHSILNDHYGKQLRMKIVSKETNGGENSNSNILEKSTDYTVENCAPTNEANQVSFENSATELTSTITWSGAADSADKLTYIVEEVHGTGKETVVTAPGTGDSSANQVATITKLEAGVKYQHAYIYQKAIPTSDPYPALFLSKGQSIAGEKQFGGKFFAKGVPTLESVTYALKDASATMFDRLVIKGDAQGHAIEQFYVLANTKLDNIDVHHVEYKLVDAAGVKDMCDNDLDNDADASANIAPGKFVVTVIYGSEQNSEELAVDLTKQMVFAAMDTKTTVDPVNFQNGQDISAANYVKNYDAVTGAFIEFVETASNELFFFTTASGQVDASLSALSNMLDASGKIQGLAAYDVAAAAVEPAHDAWSIADASHVSAFNAKADATRHLNDFSNNFLPQAKAETARLFAAKNNVSQSANDQDAADAAYNTWNNTSVRPSTRTINNRTIRVDGSGVVTYVYSDNTATVPLPNGTNPQNVDGLVDAINTAFGAALINAGTALNDASGVDGTEFATLQAAINTRKTTHKTYSDKVTEYNKLREEITIHMTAWNNSLSGKRAALNADFADFDDKFAKWKVSKQYYGYENFYESIGTTESEVDDKKASADAIKTTYKLNQSVPAELEAKTIATDYNSVSNSSPQ